MKKILYGKLKYFIIFAILGAGGLSVFLAKSCLSGSENTRFEKYIDKIFCQEISANTLNLHYTLAYPEDYGIGDYQISLGTLEPEALEKNLQKTEHLRDQLENFHSDKLSEENRIIWDILSLEFSSRLSLGNNYLLQEPLGPNLGIQAQLPVLLAEYTFRTSADIKDYFSLLASVPEYFEGILDFEKKKSEENLFMSDTSADRVIFQCESFLETGRDNYLYEMFNERVEELLNAKRISRHQADSFIEMHDKLMEQYIFPAYRSLAQGLEALKGTGKNTQGLAHWKGGKDYYEYLLKSSVGDYRSVDEILEELFRQLQSDYSQVQNLLLEDPRIISQASQLPHSDLSPEQMLEYLQHVITDDFPDLSVRDYEVKYVPESMEDFSSPAFYLTPPVDTLSPNIIYINSSSQVSQAELFTTLAHEGFPGHLYQTVYFSSQDHHPIRELLSCSGYTEGWATYVESLAYGYAAPLLDIDTRVMDFLCLNRSISLCLYSILDIGIHYQGWNSGTTADTLASFGITDQETAAEIFQYIIENPANYLKYYLGYLNFISLRDEVRSIEGNSFYLKDFHESLLKIGPGPFPVVKKYLLSR